MMLRFRALALYVDEEKHLQYDVWQKWMVSIYLRIYLLIYIYTYLSIYLSIYLSV